MLHFLGTKIGISLIISSIIIAGAFVYKFKTTQDQALNDIGVKVTALADKSVLKAVENGSSGSKPWEDILRELSSTSTIDEKIAVFNQNASSSTNVDKPLTATDRFSQAFFTKYIELKRSGAPIDETSGFNIVNELLTQDFGGPEGEYVYTQSDIVTSDLVSIMGFKDYGNTLGSAFSKPVPAEYENELIIMNRLNDTGDKAHLKKLPQNIARYTDIRQELLDIPAPKALKNIHLALINSLSYIIEGVKGMALIETDPVGATKMILKYDEGLKALELLTKQLSYYFKQQKVTFSSTEPGYIFTE